MQDIFRNNPFIRLLIPFLIGILIGFFFDPGYDRLVLYLIYMLVVIWMLITIFAEKRVVHLQNWLIIGIFFLLGFSRALESSPEPVHYNNKIPFSAQIIDYPDTTAKSLKLKLDLGYEITDSGFHEMSGDAFVYLSKPGDSIVFDIGDYLLMQAKPEQIENQGNPGEFDFKTWAASQGFYYQFYVDAKDWVKVKNRSGFDLTIYLKKFRRRIFNFYRESGISDKQLAVFSALTLGDKSMLEHDLRQGYVAAGLMHVLAVSGLHVGIIYLIISYLLKPLSGNSWGKFFRFLISMVVLWGYAMFTGMSPSVSRAATMFSVFVIGDLLGRRYAVYNSIALAAFILLFNNPSLITNVGFQMSFLAVLGIVSFYPVVYRWIYVPWKPLDKVWQLMAVSIAAQVITTPLSLYYFHQFPLLFLLSNLLMVPLATLLMYLFVLLLVFMPFPILALKIGQFVDFITSIMNAFTQWVGSLSWATLKSVYVSELQLFLLYLFIAVITLWGFKTNYRNLKGVFFVLFLFLATAFWQNFHRSHNQSFVVFNTFGESLSMHISGRQYQLFNPDSLENTSWYTKPLEIRYGLKKLQPGNNRTQNKAFFIAGNKDSRVIYYNTEVYPEDDGLDCRWLVLSDKSPYNLNPLLEKLAAGIVIADASASDFKTENWQKQIKKTDIHFHDVKQNGAFVAKWR